MSSETSRITSESNIASAGGLNFNETELTLGLPGESRGRMSGGKRGFSKLGSPDHFETNRPEIECSGARNPPPAKEHVGWPPVRSHRKIMMKSSSSCKYIKVAVDGAPYLRKVDLETYAAYQQLMCALEDMFSCFTIRNVSNEKKLMDPLNGMEYVPTYEDKDGDWMLVGDVPWKMFVETCKRIRLMKSSEAINELAPRTPPKRSNSSCC